MGSSNDVGQHSEKGSQRVLLKHNDITAQEYLTTINCGSTSDIRYVRFNGRFVDDYTKEDVIITVNEEIV